MSYVKRIHNCGYSLYPNENFIYSTALRYILMQGKFKNGVFKLSCMSWRTFYYIYKCNTSSLNYLNVLCMNNFLAIIFFKTNKY